MTEEAVTPSDLKRLDAQLDALHLSHVKSHYQAFATTAAQKQLTRGIDLLDIDIPPPDLTVYDGGSRDAE